MTIAQAAERLGVSTKTVRRWIKAGRLPAELVDGPYGPEYRVPATAVQTAAQVVDVVRVERANDPRTLALAIVQALEQRDAALRQELERLRAEVERARQEAAAAADALRRLEEREAERQRREEERARKQDELLAELRRAAEERWRSWWRRWLGR